MFKKYYTSNKGNNFRTSPPPSPIRGDGSEEESIPRPNLIQRRSNSVSPSSKSLAVPSSPSSNITTMKKEDNYNKNRWKGSGTPTAMPSSLRNKAIPSRILCFIFSVTLGIAMIFYYPGNSKNGWRKLSSFFRFRTLSGSMSRRSIHNNDEIIIYQSQPPQGRLTTSEINRMQAMVSSLSTSSKTYRYEIYSEKKQRDFLSEYGNECYPPNSDEKNLVLERYDSFLSFRSKLELWKYCALYVTGGIYIDYETIMIHTLDDILTQATGLYTNKNYAVLSSYTNDGDGSSSSSSTACGTIHDSSLFILQERNSYVAMKMIRSLVEVSEHLFTTSNPLLLEQMLYSYISQHIYGGVGNEETEQRLVPGVNGNKWILLPLVCNNHVNQENDEINNEPLTSSDLSLSKPTTKHSDHPELHCSLLHGYCCHVISPSLTNTSPEILLVTRHPHFASSIITATTTAHDNNYYDTVHNDADEPYIAKITPQTIVKSQKSQPQEQSRIKTPNMFEILFENDCLPTERHCHKCLRSPSEKKGSCEFCSDVCACYCKILCLILPEEKLISKIYWVDRPLYRRDGGRMIPRIVHQTWFEQVTPEKYPNMSRLIQSWKRSGWEYKFYTDDDCVAFLSKHFPPEVLQAYNAIIPGAFKADLFRYCVLFIYGGIYADMDVLLETSLDDLLKGDIGFMIPLDEPGSKVGHRMCLWNGLLASAPGHPILARVIELVVNNIRNRYTGVDYDTMFCPSPVLSVSHTVDMLLTTGPCILGAAMNDVLKRHMQSNFVEGEVDIWEKGRDSVSGGTAAVDTTRREIMVEGEDPNYDPRYLIPGRTIILNQNKLDMGAHRFTFTELNVIVAATDMPGYEDRSNQKSNHYSKTRVRAGIYGLEKLYVDNEVADEEIRIRIRT